MEIFGINWNRDDTTSNELATANNDLPWLQDTFAENVRGRWEATYRDVVILDPLNRSANLTYNLTSNNLGQAANREELKRRLRLMAQWRDEDQDGLADDWEERYVGNLEVAPDDRVGGERSNEVFLNYAFGLPAGSSAFTGPQLRVTRDGTGQAFCHLTYRRRLGTAGGLVYEVQGFNLEGAWEESSLAWTIEKTQETWDGTGTELVTLAAPVEGSGSGLFRVAVKRE